MKATRVVLDTNCLVSALLFKRGRLTALRRAWQNGLFRPLVCRETAAELIRVLAYPKFRLSKADLEALLAEFLPFAEICPVKHPAALVPGLSRSFRCRLHPFGETGPGRSACFRRCPSFGSGTARRPHHGAGEFPQDAGALINEDHVPRPGLTARAGPEKTRKRETVGLGPRAFPVIFRSAGTDPHCLQTGRPGPGRNGCLCRRL